jgi:DNA replication protein DnaC
MYRTKCNGKDCDKEFCEKKYRLDTLFNNSCLTENQRKKIVLRTDADGTDVNEFRQLANIEKQIEGFVVDGFNLYLHSYGCGNGKTSWAIRLISSYFNKIWHKSNFGCQALFISVPRYLLALKENITGHSEYADFINAHVKDADLVIWDDIAAKTGSEFELNHLFNLINYRLDAGKSNIFTSNLGPKEMPAALGERLASRICNKSIRIELHGSDKRALSLFSQEAK